MLNRKNLRTTRPMEKLDHKMFGPVVVKRKVGSRAYEVELPERWDTSERKISLHPMHPMLLKASGDRNEGRKLKNDNLPKCVS